MKYLPIVLVFIVQLFSAQRILPLDSVKIKGTTDFFVDDYSSIYLYKNEDFSFTKYDSLGNQLGKLMFTTPFKIQSVQNPLNIPAFSENAQELRFYDQNLNLAETISLRQKFGHIRMLYAEDRQKIWLLDERMNRLVSYDFRNERILYERPLMRIDETVTDLIVHKNTAYILVSPGLVTIELQTGSISEFALAGARRIARENLGIFILEKQAIWLLDNGNLKLWHTEPTGIVDKNSTSFFAIKDNKLYLYPIKKQP